MSAQTELILSTVVKGSSESVKAVNDIKKSVEGLSDSVKSSSKQVSSFGSTFKDTFAALGAYDIAKKVGSSMLDLAKTTIGLASGLEQTKVSFTTMTGSARIADAFIREMTTFAKNTPFEIGQIETASKQLLAYGISIQDVIPDMKMLGDIASGVGMDKLPQLILAFGQVSAATKLTGNELRQFTEAGVPLLEELAKTMGKSVPEIKNMVTAGKVGFPDVQKALASLTGEGGRFFNLMENQSKTFGGMVSNFKDTLTIMLRDLGTEFLPGLKEMLSQILKFWDENGKAMSVSFSGFISEIVSTLGTALKGLAEAVDFFGQFFQSSTETTSDNVAFSWKNLFLYLDAGMKSLKLLIEATGFVLARAFISASYNAQIGWSKFTDFMKVLSSDVGTIGIYIGKNLANGILQGAELARQGINKLISGLNAILPDSAQLNYYTKAIDDIGVSFAGARVEAEKLSGITESFGQDAISLEKAKEAALSGFDSDTRDKIRSSVGDIEQTFVKFKNAQNDVGQSGESLAKVLQEIGNATNTAKAGVSDLKSSGLDKMKKSIEDVKNDASALAKKLIEDTAKQKESIDKLNESFTEMQKKYIAIGSEGVAKVDEMKNALYELGKKGAESIKQLQKDLSDLVIKGDSAVQKIKDSISELNSELSGVKSTGISDIARRAIEAQKEYNKLIGIAGESAVLAKAKGMSADDLSSATATGRTFDIGGKTFSGEDLQKVLSLTKEIAIAKGQVTSEDLAQAEINLQKTEVEKIIEKMALDQQAIQVKITAATEEMARQQELNRVEREAASEKINNARISHQLEMQQAQKKIERTIVDNAIELAEYKLLMDKKLQEIKKEEIVYKNLIDSKKKLDDEYFAKFGEQLQAQLNQINSLARRIQAVTSTQVTASAIISGARASGGPVSGGASYLVGEEGPEIFTPSSSGNIIPNNKIGGGSNIVINITGMFGSDAVGEISDAIVTNLKRASYI